ncbi:MAG: methionine--tRNA ligase [Gammaproteobacteria bacterium]|nr:methionine--tRNA ligase [Gammaproteobacteria bacterium]
MTQRQILVTSALLYANGPIHLGHMIEAIQTDIWVRFQKMRGHECHYICGSDAHGTPIMLKAEQNGEAPETMVARISAEQQRSFAGFHVHFDYYQSTHSPVNQSIVNDIYEKINARGDIVLKEIEQCFDTEKGLFLPDRFVKGECPRCHAKDQYGDSCEACGATYQPTELIDPISALSGSTPSVKKSIHHFFKLTHYHDFLQEWARTHLQAEMQNKLKEWFDQGLADWDISRDAPYFGFLIPGSDQKYFYVWLDAPIGYLASFKTYCEQHQLDFDHYWNQNATPELHHFLGKDIMYFHALFWPALLHAANLRTPTQIHCHGFLTINSLKMSKSRGTFVNADHYLSLLNPEALRYYFAAKLSSGVEDIDLNLEDFTARVNSDLVGKFVNIASRSASFIHKKFDGALADHIMNPELLKTFTNKSNEIAQLYETLQYSKLIREIMQLADLANQFVDQHQPWTLAKDETRLPEVQLICTQALNLFKILLVYLKPILPALSEQAEYFLNTEKLDWQSTEVPLLNQKINAFTPLITRLDSERVAELLNTQN